MRLLRPNHWVKNLFVLAPLVFAGKLLDGAAWANAGLAFAGFCLLSSGVYAFNDVWDAEEDRAHPLKRFRPVAAGELGETSSLVAAALMLSCGCAVNVSVSFGVCVAGLLFITLHVLYTLWLKNCILVDVMCIAAGFVLRAFAGALAIGVPVSLWLLVCTFTLCMFLGFAKRRCEVAALQGDVSDHRATLSYYTVPLLDHLLSVSAGLAVVTYLLYTVEPRTIQKVGTPYLFFSVPFVIYCVFRVALRTEAGDVSGPTEAVTTDKPFIAGFVLWAVYVGCVVTWGPQIQEFVRGVTGGLLEW